MTLELRPLTTSSWTYIQSLSQNPRIRYLDKYNRVFTCNPQITINLIRIIVEGSKGLVEILQMLSVRWKVDKAVISIYHTYAITNHPPVIGESRLEDYNVTEPNDILCKGEIIIALCMLPISLILATTIITVLTVCACVLA